MPLEITMAGSLFLSGALLGGLTLNAAREPQSQAVPTAASFALKSEKAETLGFFAEGIVFTSSFRPDAESAVETLPYRFRWMSSNNVWEIASVYHNTKTGQEVCDNSKRIPSGTRHYLTFGLTENATNSGALAGPLAFPPAGRLGLFVPWLALSSGLELPLLATNAMRRFLDVPADMPGYWDNPLNIGYYTKSNLAPNLLKLAYLAITNNGFDFQIGFDARPEVRAFRSPYDAGFMEMDFQVTEWATNDAGPFPSRATFNHWAPRYPGTDCRDIYVGLQCLFAVTNSGLITPDYLARLSKPSVLFAMDRRAPNLPGPATVNYLVTNDNWVAPTDPQIAWRTDAAMNIKPQGAHPYLRMVLCLAFLAPPLYFLSTKIKPSTNH